MPDRLGFLVGEMRDRYGVNDLSDVGRWADLDWIDAPMMTGVPGRAGRGRRLSGRAVRRCYVLARVDRQRHDVPAALAELDRHADGVLVVTPVGAWGGLAGSWTRSLDGPHVTIVDLTPLAALLAEDLPG